MRENDDNKYVQHATYTVNNGTPDTQDLFTRMWLPHAVVATWCCGRHQRLWLPRAVVATCCCGCHQWLWLPPTQGGYHWVWLLPCGIMATDCGAQALGGRSGQGACLQTWTTVRGVSGGIMFARTAYGLIISFFGSMGTALTTFRRQRRLRCHMFCGTSAVTRSMSCDSLRPP